MVSFGYGLSSLAGGFMDQLSQNDIDAMNKLKLEDEQSTLEAQKFAGQIIQNNPEIQQRVLGAGDLSNLGGFPSFGGGQPQYPPQQPSYQSPPPQQPMAPQPGQPSVPMQQPPPQQAALQPGAGSNLTGPNTVSYTPQPATNPDPRINALQRIAAGQGTPTAQGVSPLAAVPVDVYQQLRDQQHQPWLGPNNAPVGPAANAPRPAPPPGMDPNAPRPMPPQAAAPQQRPQQPPQQDAGYGGGQFPARGIDLQSAIARIQAKQPNIKPEVMFKTLTLLQKALNPESRLQLQYMNMLLSAERVRQGQERIGQAGDRKTEEKQEVGEIADAIQSGEQSPDLKGLYRIQAPLRAELAQRGVSLAKMQMEWNAAQKQIGALNSQRMIQYTGLARSVVNTIDRVNELADQMKNSGIPLMNRAKLMALTQTQGNTPAGQLAGQYLTAVNTLKEEFANLANGGYAPTEPAWKLADQQVNADFGMQQLHATLGEVRRLIGFRLQNIPNLDTLGGYGANRYTGQSGTSVVPSAPGAGGAGAGGGGGNVIRYDRDGNRIQ